MVVLVAGAVSQISPASSSYRRTVDRGYAALAAPLVAQSNSSGAQLSSFLQQGPGLDRGSFFSDLGTLVTQTEEQAERFRQITPPVPAVSAASECERSFAGRSQAISELRTALEGVLGGTTGTSGGAGGQAGATEAVESAGSALESDDSLWAQCRSAMRRGPGFARLPASTWVKDPSSWAPVSSSDFVAAVVGSPTLAAIHDLAVLDAVTSPAESQGAPGIPVVPPTTALGLQAVLVDNGNVDETDVAVVASMAVSGLQGTPAAGSASVSPRGPIDVSAGRSITVTFPTFAVSPGATYVLRVSATSRATPGNPATISVPVTISQAITSTTVYSSASPVAAGERVTYLATISDSVGGLPSARGTVAFSDDSSPITGCSAQAVSHGQATCTVSYPSAGAHAVTAAYSGDPTRSASTSAPFIEKIVSAPASPGTTRAGSLRRGVT